MISDYISFYWLGRVTSQFQKLKAGEYFIHSQQTPLEIFRILRSGISLSRSFTVPEGWNIYEIANLTEAKEFGSKKLFLELVRDPDLIAKTGLPLPYPDTLEGYLFPDTYQFSKNQSLEQIILTMVRRFLEVWQPIWNVRAAELGFSMNEVVTLASVVEKETGDAFERPLISGVFHNRLKKRMRLQSDPTTIYGIWQRYDGNLHKSDLLEQTPYNTYAIRALPVGPISNPGKEALRAALYPEQTQDLYFVSKNDGTHVFSATLQQHNAAVRFFQMNPKAREGKSWRDLKKQN